MGKPKAPEPPDYSGVAAANEKSAQLAYKLGQQQLAWAKKQYASDSKVYNKIVDGFLSDMDETSANAAKDRLFYEQNYQPLEKDLINDAKTYDTPQRRQQEMGAAQEGVAKQFNAQRDNAEQDLEAYGIDPSATRYKALDIGTRTAQAAAQAAAGTAASNRVEDTARALRSEAINVGKGYPGQINQSYQTSSQQGSGAAAVQGQGTSIGGQTMGTAPQYFGQQQNALSNWGNTLTQGYNAQLNQFNANQNASSGWGSALGLIGGIAGKAFALDDGGVIPDGPPDPRQVGAIPEEMSPSRGEQTDDVPANLNVGEFVIPEDTVKWYGEKHMYGLIDKANKEREETMQQTGAIPDVAPQAPGPVKLETA